MKIFNWFLKPFKNWLENYRFKRRMKELRKKDPFIYK
jgi:hypothetical protein